jgi:plasmid maintenance system antidote protein VapI
MGQTIHIGNIIRDKLREDGRTVAWLAGKLHCDTSNIYRIFQKSHIDSEQLFNLSIIMGYDFFADYSACLATHNIFGSNNCAISTKQL